MTRGRKPLLIPSRSLHIHIDNELAKLIDARLWSEAEQRVPKGAYQQFFTEAAVRMLRQQPLDLSPFLGSMPLEHIIHAFAPTREALKTLLERSTNAGNDTRDAKQDSHVEGEGNSREPDGG